MKKLISKMRSVSLTCIIFMFVFSLSVQASYMKDVPVKVKQPDGTELTCLATGNEFHNWLHDAKNFTIIKNPVTGYYVYAILVNGKLAPSAFIAGKTDPASKGILPGVNLSETEVAKKTQELKAQKAIPQSNLRTAAAAPVRPATGIYNNLVIFISFSDQAEISTPLSQITPKFNTLGINSVRDFYKEVSNSQLDVVTSFYPVSSGTYPISYHDSHPRSYYTKDAPDGYNNTSPDLTTREHTLLANAVRAVQNQVPANLLIDGDNDGNIDNIVFVINGYNEGWSDLLWPHRWSLFSETVSINGKRAYDYNVIFTEALGVGVICHELFHSFGAPDLYHYTDYPHDPVGDWDLMASGDWNTPRHMTVHFKQRYAHWVASVPTLTAAGRYSLAPLSRSPYAAYRINLPDTDQFLMLEYRKKEGRYESALSGQEGLIIYRVNPNIEGNANNGPEELYIFRPDGTNSVNGSLYQAAFSQTNSRTRFDDYTNPACFLTDGTPGGLPAFYGITNVSVLGDVISFDYMGGDTGNKLPVVQITNPKSTSTLTAPASFVIVANASDADGSIAKVEFFNGTTLLGTVTSIPYSFYWQNVAAGTYTIIAKATDNGGATATTSVTITVQPGASLEDIIGNACGQNGGTATYSLNASNRTNATGYNWWYTGNKQSLTPVVNQPYNAVMTYGSAFSGGQLCVGVNYSAAPWYKQFCKNLSACPSNINAFRVDETEQTTTVVSPNPSVESFTITLKKPSALITIMDSKGTAVKQLSGAEGTVEFGNDLLTGIYMLSVVYTDNTTENIRVVKIK
ncbi:M6 family metalloprotease domain-containing protein [Cytophaga hutchinsonii]|nr:M6 family metalloprotease domain-containing protein [Cytophaga hutchinsonii]SFX44802.1 M6 family metalloprotease domain-containing protein/Por secretion system C-terminal sorting domain-containing protein [Cytophaga hutchinsonii ATCC 33406]